MSDQNDLRLCVQRLASAILTQDASLRALAILVEKHRDAATADGDRVVRILSAIEKQQGAILECLRITQADVSDVKETTGKHALLKTEDIPQDGIELRVAGKMKLSDLAVGVGRVLWRLRMLWAISSGAAILKLLEKLHLLGR